MKEVREQQQQQGMYRPEFEHDNCGIGAVVNIKGKKNHDTVANALKIVEHLEHRAGKDAEGKTGDGVGILLQISHKFFKKACKKVGFEIGDEREYGCSWKLHKYYHYSVQTHVLQCRAYGQMEDLFPHLPVF